MVRGRLRRVRQRGFALLELMLVVAVVGIVAVIAAPSLLAVWRAWALSAGVAELSTALNRARQLAVTENASVCVQPVDVGVRLRLPGCAGVVWTGPGTDSTGLLRLSDGLGVQGDATIVFTRLGAAAPAGRLTVRERATGRSRDVLVAATGQVSAP